MHHPTLHNPNLKEIAMQHLKWFLISAVLIVFLISVPSASADDPFGGPPTKDSGNGTTTRGAIYINECTNSIAFAPNSVLWFKVDAWLYHKLLVWLDDDPHDSAAKYFEGSTSDQSPNLVNGFWLKVYPPEALGPNYAYRDQKHRADLLTTDNGIRPDGSELTFVGMANHNQFIPEHLLWYEAVFDGWVYLRVENKMPQKANAIICAIRVRYMDDPPPPEYQDEPDHEFIPYPDRRDNS
jgi:hypothetical protein